jgi:arsenite methyltransferase
VAVDTDIWLDPSRLDPGLSGFAGRVACLADARPIAELVAILERAGLEVELVERHDDALGEMIEQVETGLRALRLVDPPPLRAFNLRRGVELARRAADVVAKETRGNALVMAASDNRRGLPGAFPGPPRGLPGAPASVRAGGP